MNNTEIEKLPKYTKPKKDIIETNKELYHYLKSNNRQSQQLIKLLKYAEIGEINSNIITRYMLNNNYYIFGTEKRDSIWKSILYIIDSNLLMMGDDYIEKYINCLRNKMGMELDARLVVRSFKQTYA